MEESRKIENIYLDVIKLSQEQLKFLGENLKELYKEDKKMFKKGTYYEEYHEMRTKYLIWRDKSWFTVTFTFLEGRKEVSFNEFLEITNLLEEIGENMNKQLKDFWSCQETKIDLLDDDKLSKIAEMLIYFDFESVSKINGHSVQELRKSALKLLDLAWRKTEQHQEPITVQNESFVCTTSYNEGEINLNLKHFTTEWSTNS